MSDATFTLTAEIRRVVRNEIRYLRTYWGEVLATDDPKSKGRVLVSVPMLGWDTRDKAAWAQPRDRHSMVVPDVGEHVMVGFLEGDRDKPYYQGQAHEISGQTPEDYDGPTKAVVHQDESLKIVVDRSTGEVTIKGSGAININGQTVDLNGEARTLVTHAELDTALQAFASSINAAIASAITGHTHSGVTTGPGVSGPGAGAGSSASVDISAAEASTVRTG